MCITTDTRDELKESTNALKLKEWIHAWKIEGADESVAIERVDNGRKIEGGLTIR